MSLLLRRARTLDSPHLVDIEVQNGLISRIERSLSEKKDEAIDAAGKLVLPTFVEPHVHLDKAFLAERGIEAESVTEARRLVRESKEKFTVKDIAERAERCIRSALADGVTAIRSHVDVDSIVELKSVTALIGLKNKYRGLLDLQVVAFPQEGVLKEKGSFELLMRALDAGASVVGGLPEVERTNQDGRKQIEVILKLAKGKGLDLDVHCDVKPFTTFVNYYAAQVIEEHLQGRATADHLIALAYYNDQKAAKTIGLLRRARMNVIVNPCTMISSGSRDPPPKGRGVSRINELVNAGLNFSFGLDNVVDPYNPFGEFDPLRNGWLLAYQGFLNTRSDIKKILMMPTYNAARILRLARYGLKKGCRADFNVLNVSSSREALRTRAFPVNVIKGGRVIVDNNFESKRRF